MESSTPELKGQLLDGSSFDLTELEGNFVLVDGVPGVLLAEEKIPILFVYNEFKDKKFKEVSVMVLGG